MRDIASLAGQILDAKYRLDELLGQGGMGAVFRATHLGTDRVVALKLIAPGLMDQQDFVARFQREARATGRLRHPNIVDLTDFGFAEIDGRKLAYLVMEFLEGETLAALLQRNPTPPIPFVVDVVQQVCSALQEAHDKGIVHRDLKPENIWLEPNRRGGYTVKILDFGLAKIYDPKARAEGKFGLPVEDDATLALAPSLEMTEALTPEKRSAPPPPRSDALMTEVGTRLGTPAYMSPEQCRGVDLDHHSDLYSLGVIVYQMMSGHTPFTGNSMELINKHIQSTVPHLGTVRKGLPDGACALVMAALDKDPAQRPSTAETFGEAFGAYCESPLTALKAVMEVANQHAAVVGRITLLSFGAPLAISVLFLGLQLIFGLLGKPSLPGILRWTLVSVWSVGILFGMMINASAMPAIFFHGWVLPLRPIAAVPFLQRSRTRLYEHLKLNLRLFLPLIIPALLLAVVFLVHASRYPGRSFREYLTTFLPPVLLLPLIGIWFIWAIFFFKDIPNLSFVPPILLVEDCPLPEAIRRSKALKRNPLTRFRSASSPVAQAVSVASFALFAVVAGLMGVMVGSMAAKGTPLPSLVIPVSLFAFTVLSIFFTPVLEMLVGYRYLRLRRMCRESLRAAFENLRARMEAAGDGK